jgi:hypothetical protein
VSTAADIEVLERWVLLGGTWRIRSISADRAEIELCTCVGEPVERLESSDPGFLAHVAARREQVPPPDARCSSRR